MSHDEIVKNALELAASHDCSIFLNNIRPHEVKCVHVAEGTEQLVLRKMWGTEPNQWSLVTIKFLPF